MFQSPCIDNGEVLRMIECARTQLGITEYEMCKRAGITQGAFSNVKSNRRRLHVAMARQLSVALGLSMTEVFEAAGLLPKTQP